MVIKRVVFSAILLCMCFVRVLTANTSEVCQPCLTVATFAAINSLSGVVFFNYSYLNCFLDFVQNL